MEHSAPHMAQVICTAFKSRRLTMTQSTRCQCLELGCIQEILCLSRSWKVFVMARPKSEQRELPEASTIHVANTMMTNDSMPYVVISADPGIEISQQYDFVVLRNPSEGGIQRVIKAIFDNIR